MKQSIHPNWYPEATVTCACGNTWKTGATVAEIRTDICSACHPFFTGEQRIVDTEGQVDRFLKRLQVRDNKRAEQQQRDAAREPENAPISEFGLERKFVSALNEAGYQTAGDLVRLLTERGEEALLDVAGIGRKAVADVKKALASRGFELPSADTAG
ncbi:MAG: 50S ribosomal protein L31 [Anaerolineae bacterium]|nr:50S ribosomal protein L31 [Anaerolineae bacterium]